MNVLILGSGGREHALAWKVRQSERCRQLWIAPGNAGTAQLGSNVNVSPSDFAGVSAIIEEREIDMVVVGPEVPLVAGLADHLQRIFPELMVIGPTQQGAMLEGSKAFAKEFMAENNIPTAGYIEITKSELDKGLDHINKTSGPYVLKADGLAAGKGVLILEDPAEARRELKEMLGGKFGTASSKVVIEDFLSGIEFSVFVLTDGTNYVLLPEAKDYKRIGEGDTGLNTGGMGTVSPVPFADEAMMKKVTDRIIQPTLTGLQRTNIDYCGFIFFGLINVEGNPYVIEYNCRLGDPEAQVIIPRMDEDLVSLFVSAWKGELRNSVVSISDNHCVAVVLSSGGYPSAYEKGYPVEGLEDASPCLVFHAGTVETDGVIQTNGGRVLAVTAIGEHLESAREKALQGAEHISFEGRYFRKDIGLDLL